MMNYAVPLFRHPEDEDDLMRAKCYLEINAEMNLTAPMKVMLEMRGDRPSLFSDDEAASCLRAGADLGGPHFQLALAEAIAAGALKLRFKGESRTLLERAAQAGIPKAVEKLRKMPRKRPARLKPQISEIPPAPKTFSPEIPLAPNGPRAAISRMEGAKLLKFDLARLVLALILGTALYVLPSVIALVRRHPRTVAIIIVDLAFGWTLLGWAIALVWSLVSKEKTPLA